MTAPTAGHLTSPDDDLTAALRTDARLGLPPIRSRCRPSGSTTHAAANSSRRSPDFPSTTRPAPSELLLERVVGEIAAAANAEVLVELGSGSAAKTRLLLDALTAQEAAENLCPAGCLGLGAARGRARSRRVPGLSVHGVVSDFTDTLHNLPRGGRRMIAFLGGTIGNLVPAERAEFLAGINEVLEPGERSCSAPAWSSTRRSWSPPTTTPRASPRNSIAMSCTCSTATRRRLRPRKFEHVALWDAENEWIEMRLRATEAMKATVAGLDLTVDFAAGEEMRTEISAKFRPVSLAAELDKAGLAAHAWTDPDNRFILALAERR